MVNCGGFGQIRVASSPHEPLDLPPLDPRFDDMRKRHTLLKPRVRGVMWLMQAGMHLKDNQRHGGATKLRNPRSVHFMQIEWDHQS